MSPARFASVSVDIIAYNGSDPNPCWLDVDRSEYFDDLNSQNSSSPAAENIQTCILLLALSLLTPQRLLRRLLFSSGRTGTNIIVLIIPLFFRLD